MPCDSTVTKTTMTDEARLSKALSALGYADLVSTKFGVTASKDNRRVEFYRQTERDAFRTTTARVDEVNATQRKYTEITVRDYARRKGFTVQQDGNKLTLINRRVG